MFFDKRQVIPDSEIVYSVSCTCKGGFHLYIGIKNKLVIEECQVSANLLCITSNFL